MEFKQKGFFFLFLKSNAKIRPAYASHAQLVLDGVLTLTEVATMVEEEIGDERTTLYVASGFKFYQA